MTCSLNGPSHWEGTRLSPQTLPTSALEYKGLLNTVSRAGLVASMPIWDGAREQTRRPKHVSHVKGTPEIGTRLSQHVILMLQGSSGTWRGKDYLPDEKERERGRVRERDREGGRTSQPNQPGMPSFPPLVPV